MINGKGIRNLCYILVRFVCVISIVLLVWGISYLISEPEGRRFGWILIVISIVSPLVATVSLYPIFVLANIDDILKSLNSKMDKVLANNPPEASRPVEPQSESSPVKNEVKVDSEYHDKQVDIKRII